MNINEKSAKIIRIAKVVETKTSECWKPSRNANKREPGGHFNGSEEKEEALTGN